ncbi:hypothetical protein FQR65_LT20871 [Abscondita terminalis]|nr:hypothetical protein FQR65_LT20871 [Abscondita terminalis]
MATQQRGVRIRRICTARTVTRSGSARNSRCLPARLREWPGSSPRCAMSRKRTERHRTSKQPPRGRPSMHRAATRTGDALRGSFCRPTRASLALSSVPLDRREALFSSGALLGIAINDRLALLVLRNHALLRHDLALLSELNVLADHRVVLLQHEAVRGVPTILPSHVGEPGARRRAELDDRTSATTASMPRASITLMPFADREVRGTLAHVRRKGMSRSGAPYDEKHQGKKDANVGFHMFGHGPSSHLAPPAGVRSAVARRALRALAMRWGGGRIETRVCEGGRSRSPVPSGQPGDVRSFPPISAHPNRNRLGSPGHVATGTSESLSSTCSAQLDHAERTVNGNRSEPSRPATRHGNPQHRRNSRRTYDIETPEVPHVSHRRPLARPETVLVPQSSSAIQKVSLRAVAEHCSTSQPELLRERSEYRPLRNVVVTDQLRRRARPRSVTTKATVRAERVARPGLAPPVHNVNDAIDHPRARFGTGATYRREVPELSGEPWSRARSRGEQQRRPVKTDSRCRKFGAVPATLDDSRDMVPVE